MAAPLNNKYWKNRSKHGAPFAMTAEELENSFLTYQQWLEEETFERPELIKSGDMAGQVVNVLVKTPPDQLSFCLHAGIDLQTFYNYCTEEYKEKQKDLFEVATRVRAWISSKQLRGATAGIYNANIVSRVNNLQDNVNVEHSGEQQTINISLGGKDIKLDR